MLKPPPAPPPPPPPRTAPNEAPSPGGGGGGAGEGAGPAGGGGAGGRGRQGQPGGKIPGVGGRLRQLADAARADGRRGLHGRGSRPQRPNLRGDLQNPQRQ
ncbi:uncharacterized protein VK521_016384, partial [Ammospiza maritima maritima]